MPQPPTELNNLQLWNVSRSIAGNALDAVFDSITTNTDTPTRSDVDHRLLSDNISDARMDSEYWPFSSDDDVVDVVAEYADFKRSREHIDALTEYISNRLVNTQTSNNSTTTPTSNSDNRQGDRQEIEENGDGGETWQIAKDLYSCFLGVGDTSLSEIRTAYETAFPDRSVLLRDVMNTNGTPKERVDQIQSLVEGWHQNDEEVDRLDKFSRKPMGLNEV
jgi:hypothetical protein